LANFIKKFEGFTAQPQSQVRLEEWQKFAREAKLFQHSPESQINRLDLADKLSSSLEHNVKRLKDYPLSDNQELSKNAFDMIAYIKSDKNHSFSVPQEKAQQIESSCRDTFIQRSQELLRERYLICVYPECTFPLAKEFGGLERFVRIEMGPYEKLCLPKDASEEFIRQEFSSRSAYSCYVNRTDNVIIITRTYRNNDAYDSEEVYNYPKTLPSSEVLSYMYQEADQHFRQKNPGSTPPKNEITVIVYNIENHQSRGVLGKLDIPREKKLYRRYEESEIFQELENTPSGRPIFFALAQHPEQFGRLEVDSIEVRKDNGYYHMILYASPLYNDTHPQGA
jgi:hypothetical protein